MCLVFACKMGRMLPQEFWTESVGFYLDGSSFAQKTNLMIKQDQQSLWHGEKGKKGEKAETGSQVAHFMVAISYGNGFLSCGQFYGNLNGLSFAEMIREHFSSTFHRCSNPRYMFPARYMSYLKICCS